MLKSISATLVHNSSNLLTSTAFLTYTRTHHKRFLAMTGNVKIGTHNGHFHCDEALACFMLKTLPRYKDATVVRSRDKTILDTCDIVVDVGGEYDPSKHRYDHHMRTFNESLSTVIKKPGYNCQIKLSSAGLIYCHFGHEIIKQLLPEISDSDTECIFKKIYDTFIKEIDGIDNGVSMYKEEPLYRIVTDLSSRVNFLNPSWNSKADVDEDLQFHKAVELTGQEFMQHVHYKANVWLPARSIVQESIEKRFEVDPSGEIIVLSQPAPCFEHLYSIEKALNIQPSLKYVIFGEEDYRVRCVPINKSSFVCRLFLPEAWAGLRDANLVHSSGIEGAKFVHVERFIGGHNTREGAIEMARKSLELARAT